MRQARETAIASENYDPKGVVEEGGDSSHSSLLSLSVSVTRSPSLSPLAIYSSALSDVTLIEHSINSAVVAH